jgi:hypothetical protein
MAAFSLKKLNKSLESERLGDFLEDSEVCPDLRAGTWSNRLLD